MKRRDFLILSAMATATVVPISAEAKPIDYTPGLVEKHLAEGDTVFLDFKAHWCTTCAAQERRITSFKEQNPAYEANITFINVDWDDYHDSSIVEFLKIPRRSTLVVLKGNQELGRIVASANKNEIKALMDKALNAATT
ncbi:thioredoxin domain-containing protein [Pseudopelagicola sp. nBUS_19]|mgnify:CR=1 FL=1|uniref:thioredoxin domain-containing protein n=1 Tax=unclassified Pseudopelagicola TaxID=2649563 RepID=UPI003EC0338A